MNINEYYIEQSKTTNPGKLAYLFDDLPNDIATLCKIVQSLILHYADQEMFHFKIPKERYYEMNTRYVSHMLAMILTLDNGPLINPRDLNKRMIGICRDNSVLLCSILRHKKIPARLRVGFANYFNPDIYLDGMCVEYWDQIEKKWSYVDTRTMEVHVDHYHLNLDFSLYDIPEGRFIPAGKAWQWCRQNKINADRFGSRQHRGLWYIRNRLLQELAVLNKREVLIWDLWGMMLENEIGIVSDEQIPLLDALSEFINENIHDVAALQSYYVNRQDLTVPHQVLIVNPFYNEKITEIDI